MADPPGGTGHHTRPAKIGTRARAVLWVQTNHAGALVPTGDGVVDDLDSSADATSAAPSRRGRGAPKKDRCRKCSQRGKACGPSCLQWPRHTAASAAAAAEAAEVAATTAVATSVADSAAAMSAGAEAPAAGLAPSADGDAARRVHLYSNCLEKAR